MAKRDRRSERADDVLVELRSGDAMSAADLVEATGLSRPTVISILNDLESSGWVNHGAVDSGGVGRPATTWTLGDNVGIVIGADILVDSMLLVAVTFGGTILAARSSRLGQHQSDARLEAVVSAVESLRDSYQDKGPLLHLAVSTTGIVDGDGRVVRSDLVPQWTGMDLGQRLSRRLDVTVSVDNDINMAAYGEFCQRRQRGRLDADADMLLVRMTRGLHTGLVLNGQLHRGRAWNAGEISDVLDLRLEGDETPGDDWIDRAALTTGSVAAVIDPDLIVMSGPTDASVSVIRRIIARLVSRRPRDAESMTAEVEELGRAASVVGALNTALEMVTRTAVGVEHPHPVTLQGMDKIISEVERGQHSVMKTTHREGHTGDGMRVGIVGVGARSRLALNAELEGNDGVVTAVCEPHHLARKRVADRLGKDPDSITITSDVAGLIASGIDVAFVTSPDDTHAEVTCQLLEAGIPVYLEKPLAITMDLATKVLTTAYQTGTKLYVGHNMRHMNVVRSMRDLIRTGRIGEVKAIWCRHFVGSGGDFYFKDWHATREHGTGLLLQKAAHDIDVMHWFADSHTTDVVGMGGLTLYDQITDRRDNSDQLMGDWYSLDNWPPLTQKNLNPVIDVEDISMMLMRMESGIFASYQQCHYTPDYWRNYTVIGTEGRIENFGDGEGGVIRLWNKRTHYNADGDETYPIIGDANGHGDADVLTVTEFLNFVRNGTPTDTSPLGAWYAVAAGIEATESLRQGSAPRQVPTLDGQIIQYFNNNQIK
ncbi:ROK family protein [Cutibacterium equinum]|uniref:ROK family protein n=1 Tax=Cutibacterium equinum TaxID=3016342 RepID=UPI0038CD63B9